MTIPELTVPTAIAVATREAFVVPPPYQVAILEVPNGMIELRIVRQREGHTREFSMALGRNRTADDFAETSRKVWLHLHLEHEREHRRTLHEMESWKI